MNIQLEHVLPNEIEKRSFEIIEAELGRNLPPEQANIIKRVIHTTADFDFADSLKFSESAVANGLNALKNGVPIITDTMMAFSGINKAVLGKLGGSAMCFMGDDDIAAAAKSQGITRSTACIDKAANISPNAIFAIGNAPTALIRIYELIKDGKLAPSLIIGVPVGFVNVIQSKELIMSLDTPFIVASGRKGGSTVAAAICNALIYSLNT